MIEGKPEMEKWAAWAKDVAAPIMGTKWYDAWKSGEYGTWYDRFAPGEKSRATSFVVFGIVVKLSVISAGNVISQTVTEKSLPWEVITPNIASALNTYFCDRYFSDFGEADFVAIQTRLIEAPRAAVNASNAAMNSMEKERVRASAILSSLFLPIEEVYISELMTVLDNEGFKVYSFFKDVFKLK